MRLTYTPEHNELHSKDDKFQLSDTAVFSGRKESLKIVNFKFTPECVETDLECNDSTLLYYYFDWDGEPIMLELLV